MLLVPEISGNTVNGQGETEFRQPSHVYWSDPEWAFEGVELDYLWVIMPGVAHDFDKCILFFNEYYGCAICIAICPWSIPGRGPRIVEQLLRRREKHNGSEED